MKKIISQTYSIVTENYCRLNFVPKTGVTPGTDNFKALSCDEILARYIVNISGVTSTGNRCPSQNQLTSAVVTPANATMVVTYSSTPIAGVHYLTGVLTVIATEAITGTVSFGLDFLGDLVPAGQLEYRSASMVIDGLPLSITGIGTLGDFTKNYGVGTTNVNFTLTLTNDNWNYPRYQSNFRFKLLSGNNVNVEPNTLITNPSTYVSLMNGVTTTYLTVVQNVGGRLFSGEIISYKITRNSGPSYLNVDGYKDVQVSEVYNTGSFSSSRLFVTTKFDAANNDFQQMTEMFYHGDNDISVIPTVTGYNSLGYYARYSLINHSGVDASYGYSLSAFKYCSFTTVSYTGNIQSYVPGGHIVYLYNYSGGVLNSDLSEPSFRVIPGTTSLSSSETFTVNYTARCPSGGYIRIKSGGVTLATLYDGQTYQRTGMRFTRSEVYLSDISSTLIARFSSADQYVEIVPVTTNVVVGSPYKFAYNGLVMEQ